MLTVAHSRPSHLAAHGQVYLDYTGSALYGEPQIRAHHRLLAEGLFANPHSEHGPSLASAMVDARGRFCWPSSTPARRRTTSSSRPTPARVRYLPLDDELRLGDPASIVAEEAGEGGSWPFPPSRISRV